MCCVRHWAVLAAPLLLTLACKTPEEELRRATYPAGFVYLERGEVREEMRAMTRAAVSLDRLLRESGARAERSEILRLLDEMDAAMSELDRGAPSNHPIMDANLALLRRDLRAARDRAAADPPDLYLAGTIAGSCRYCHQ